MKRELDRTLGLFDLIAIVMGAIIGVGIFFTPKTVADITGSAPVALGAWIAGGLIALVGALTFAELGGLMPRTGGHYLVLRKSYGRFVGFLYCWSLLAVIQSGAIAIISIIGVRHLAELFGEKLSSAGETVAACAVIGAFAVINMLGVQGGAKVAKVALVLKASTLVAIAFIGLLCEPGAPSEPIVSGASGDGSAWLLLPALIPVLFTFGGWQQGLYLGGEVKNPARNLPLGIMVGVAGVAILYTLANIGFVALLDVDRLATTQTLAVDAVGAAFPGLAEKLAAIAVAVSALGIANVCIMTAPRMYKAMADDGSFFPGISAVSERFRTPVWAIAIQGSVSVGLVIAAGAQGVDWLMNGVVCIDWLFFLLTGLSLFVLRRKLPEEPRPYRAWGYPWIPGLFVLVSAVVIVASFIVEKYRSASLSAVGVVLSGAILWTVFSSRFAAPVEEPSSE